MNSDIDTESAFVEDLIDRFNSFRRLQILPLEIDFNYKGWLRNFSNSHDKYIAAKILSNFIYYSKYPTNKLLADAIGNAGHFLKKIKPEWRFSDYSKCIFASMPGERSNITDSGITFTKKLKSEIGIPEICIINGMQSACDLLRKGDKEAIIFVDDFIGSGKQCIDAFNPGTPGRDLYRMAENMNVPIIYAPLVANNSGVIKINQKRQNIHLTPVHILGDEYNLFNPNCICWNKKEDLYNDAITLIQNKSRDLEIPDNGGEVFSAKGYCDQGLFIAFEHGTPDAVPGIFYYQSVHWTPLLRKSYERSRQ